MHWKDAASTRMSDPYGAYHQPLKTR